MEKGEEEDDGRGEEEALTSFDGFVVRQITFLGVRIYITSVPKETKKDLNLGFFVLMKFPGSFLVRSGTARGNFVNILYKNIRILLPTPRP